MLKFVSGIAIIAFTTFCGYLLGRKHRQRKLFFTQLREFNERFLNEIAYYRRPIGEFIGGYEYQGEFHTLLQSFFSHLAHGGGQIDLSTYDFLTKEEKSVVEDYFFMIGKGDSASQKGYFSSAKETLSKLQVEVEATCKRYGDLYVKIGFLCGLLILLLII